MMAAKNIIRYTKNLDVGSNEYATKYSVNRILDKLLQNDKLLEEFYRKVFGELMIYEYDPAETYYYNDLVWFMSQHRDPYILRCVVNKTSRDLRLWSEGDSFERYGWKDLNPNLDAMREFGLEKKMNSWIAKKFKEHQDDKDFHPLGKLSYGGDKPTTDIAEKIASRDVSNIDPARQQTFFPYYTTYLKTSPTSPILGGQCRKYDNGLLEYDIVFRLSYIGDQVVDEDYSISASIINCNHIDLATGHDNDQYFRTTADAQIFNCGSDSESEHESEIGTTRQQSRNDFVNVYYARVAFAEAASTIQTPTPQYMNADSYMIFSGDVMCQCRDTTQQTVGVGANSLVFASKQPGAFTALLVTYPNQKFSTDGYNATNGGIEANSFHCSLIGRWK